MNKVPLIGARITPAYAGKRSPIAAAGAMVSDHPRVCGEKLAVRLSSVGVVGLPPRMRGKVP